MQSVARAESTGNDAQIRRLVRSSQVAEKIILFGQGLRRQGLTSLHVGNSLLLQKGSGKQTVVTGSIVYKTHSGSRVIQEETVIVVLHGSTAYIISDQPSQHW
jgi:hypothetical protein